MTYEEITKEREGMPPPRKPVKLITWTTIAVVCGVAAGAAVAVGLGAQVNENSDRRDQQEFCDRFEADRVQLPDGSGDDVKYVCMKDGEVVFHP